MEKTMAQYVGTEGPRFALSRNYSMRPVNTLSPVARLGGFGIGEGGGVYMKS